MKILIQCLCVVVLAGCAAEAPEGSFVQKRNRRGRDTGAR